MMSAPYPTYPASPPATAQFAPQELTTPGAHPFLREPKLYVSNLSPAVSDVDLAHAFEYCVPFRPNIMRDGTGQPVNGVIEFKHLDTAEKALATLNGSFIPGTSNLLNLSPFTPPSVMPPSLATPRLVKHLPPGTNDSFLYDLFRPYGALSSAKMETTFGAESGIVHFWNEEDAAAAEQAMHCAERAGPVQSQSFRTRLCPRCHAHSISIHPPRGANPYMNRTPPHQSPHSPRSPPAGPFIHGPGQQVQYAPSIGPGSGSHSGLIDPCNLFIKNLDPEIDSNKLFTHFKQFGQIQANAALQAMNGVFLGSKQIAVRLHEPKQLRQEKLQQRFSSPRTRSGATSPTPSEGAESIYSSFSPDRDISRERIGRRSSGSYYTAALTGSLNVSMQYDELATLTPVVRRDVLTGELTRRLKSTEGVSESEIDALADSIVGLDLQEVVQGMQSPNQWFNRLPAQDIFASGSMMLGADGSKLSERERLARAVAKIEPRKSQEITDLLLSLSKRERALCLFNAEYLRTKVSEAKEVVDVLNLDDKVEEHPARTSTPTKVPTTPEKSKTVRSTNASPQTPSQPAVHTLATLAKLPAAEIIKLANLPTATGLPLPKADPEVVKTTDEWIDSLADKTQHQRKQTVGDKLFRVIKSSGIKQAPKLTIALLDREDLRALAHLMNSYPTVLKEKVLLIVPELK
ncbi:RNA recognition motif protein [Ceratobasidium sp. AG-Ba]|nr:RNA recognition motif protein [Ceratobasidium sp. AG-Ba]